MFARQILKDFAIASVERRSAEEAVPLCGVRRGYRVQKEKRQEAAARGTGLFTSRIVSKG